MKIYNTIKSSEDFTSTDTHKSSCFPRDSREHITRPFSVRGRRQQQLWYLNSYYKYHVSLIGYSKLLLLPQL